MKKDTGTGILLSVPVQLHLEKICGSSSGEDLWQHSGEDLWQQFWRRSVATVLEKICGSSSSVAAVLEKICGSSSGEDLWQQFWRRSVAAVLHKSLSIIRKLHVECCSWLLWRTDSRSTPKVLYQGADKSLARPWKETSYSNQDLQHNINTYGVQTTAIYCCCL